MLSANLILKKKKKISSRKKVNNCLTHDCFCFAHLKFSSNILLIVIPLTLFGADSTIIFSATWSIFYKPQRARQINPIFVSFYLYKSLMKNHIQRSQDPPPVPNKVWNRLNVLLGLSFLKGWQLPYLFVISNTNKEYYYDKRNSYCI